MGEVRVAGVKVDLRSNAPVLLLQEVELPKRIIPIFIGSPEANAIDLVLSRVKTSRPLTHDLMKTFLDDMGAHIAHVVVTEVRDETYFAEIVYTVGTREHILSARPSDAVALALRSGATIYVSDLLLDAEGIVFEEEQQGGGESPSPDQIVGQFRDFLDNIKPEDFSE